MITKKTVFVLGAGASKPYGFPTASELQWSACRNVLSGAETSDQWRALQSLGVDEEEATDFRNQLRLAQRPSIDAFIRHRPEYLEIGKLTIAAGLIPNEKHESLFTLTPGDDSWYQYIWNHMHDPFDKITENQIAFITFNYDRSLEHYLITTLQAAYDRDLIECARVLDDIPIVHVYGQLGRLPWQEEGGRAYTPNVYSDSVRAAAEGIRVIGEDDLGQGVGEAVRLLTSAEQVVFLGFGYHPENLELLSFERVRERGDIKAIGTAVGLRSAEQEDIMRSWSIGTPSPGLENYAFLKENVRLS